jgi:hypothetical protein
LQQDITSKELFISVTSTSLWCNAFGGGGMKRCQARLFCVFSLLGAVLLCGQSDDPVAQRARKLHFDAMVIDTHVDTTSRFQRQGWNFTEEHTDGQLDLPRMKRGGLDALFLSIFMPGTVSGPKAVNDSLERIASVYKLAEDFPEKVAICTTADQVRAACRQGKIAALLGMEGGHMINNSLPIPACMPGSESVI